MNLTNLVPRFRKFLMIIALACITLFSLPNEGIVAASKDRILALIDLAKVEETDFYQPLDGEWFFFEDQLLLPTQVYNHILRDYAETVQLPSSFKKLTGKTSGYGTFATRVKIPEAYVGRTLAIYVPHQYSAYRLYAERSEISSNGVVGATEEEHRTELSPQLGYVIPYTNELLITMQISSFGHQRGGFEHSIFIGDASVVSKKFTTSIIWILFVAGSIFLMGMFMILFAFFRRQELVFFVFGIFCICFSMRAFFAEPFIYTLTLMKIPFRVGIVLEYLFTYSSILLLVLLVYIWFKEYFSKILLQIYVSILSLAMVITIFTKPLFFQKLSGLVFACSLLGAVYLLYVLFRGFKQSSLRSHANTVGIIFVILGMLNDYVVNKGWSDSALISLSLVAVGVYVLIQVISMSKSYADKVEETEQLNLSLRELNTNLDVQVNVRTIELKKANERLEYQASRDSLTGIFNRHRFNSFIQQTFQHALDNATSLSIVMFDIDEFKKYNDHYGHIQGDSLLKEIVNVVERKLPPNSLFARYGGEEFIIVLPDHDLNEAYVVAENARIAVEQAALPHCKRENGIATISVGVATLDQNTIYRTEIELVDAADQQLYRSKRLGRNTTSVIRHFKA